MWAWCCCRETETAANEERFKRPAVAAGFADTFDESEAETELKTPREPLAQTQGVDKSKKALAKKAQERSRSKVKGVPFTVSAESQPTTATGGPGEEPHTVLADAEKEEEKERLKSLVQQFAKQAVSEGLDLEAADPSTGNCVPVTFELDRYLMWFTVTPPPFKANRDPQSKEQHMFTSITGVYKGADVLERAPSYPPDLLDRTVLLDFDTPTDKLFFVFNNPDDKRKFYSCVKIIRLSVDISRSKLQQNESRPDTASSG